MQAVGEKSGKHSDKKIVVQVLPAPISDEQDQNSPVSPFTSLLDRLLSSWPLTPRWITAVHAVPRNYSIDELPVSASSTPDPHGSSTEATDYFAPQRVVHTAAFMIDQYDQYTPRSHPATPGLASSPSSVDVSLYQRVIPPATAREATDLFDVASVSALTDRLCELAPNGCMLFFYPTATGAHTFKRDYLDRGLASLVRSVVLGKGLPPEACQAVASIEAMGAMLEFDAMQTKLAQLLRDIKNTPTYDGARFSILSGQRAHIALPRRMWKTWWVKQEQLRVKAVIDRFFRQLEARGKVFHKDERYTARGIAHEILTGLMHDSAEEAGATTDPSPVEVGVFVIRRNA